MSRHHRIVDSLQGLQKLGRIDGWLKDYDAKNPSKVNWIVQINPVTLRRWETVAVEAFIDGASLTLEDDT